jgi:AraC-like DNA-binding protein
MRYRELAPGPAERQFVDRYWFLEDDGAETGPVDRIVPDGRPELIVNLGRPFESFHNGQWLVQPQCFFVGQLTGPLLIRSRGRASIIGVRFHPHGAKQVLKTPMDKLTDSVATLSDLSLRRSIDELDAIRSWIASTEPAGSELISEAVSRITRVDGNVDVGRLAADLGISLRQLQRNFLTQIGITPKLFARIRRFQKVFQAIEHGSSSWVDTAIECGYYDQAHLIRDFRELAGETPTALLEGADLETHFVRHMPGCRIFPRLSL